jgi:hypothetical protein
MRKSDVDRLLRAAANATESATTEAPFGFDTRVVASWRANGNRNDEVAELSRFLRRAGAIAAAVLVLAGAAAYRQYRDETKFASLATNEYAIGDSTIQTEFSR